MIAYPNNVRWLSYGQRDRFKNLWRRVWWTAYTAGVIAATVGAYHLAQALA